MKFILRIGVALLVAVGVGWVWGTWGRSDLRRAVQIAEVRDSLLEGRAAVLDARLDIYSVNFGDSSRHLEEARRVLHTAETQLNGLGRRDDAQQLAVAFTRIDEAQRLVGQLNQDANAVAADAAKAIDAVLDKTAAR